MTETADQPGWRLIDTGPLPGPDNMAIDAALLDCFAAGGSAPLLRLYGWQPPAFSWGCRAFRWAPMSRTSNP